MSWPDGTLLAPGRVMAETRLDLKQPNNPFIQPLQKSAPLDLCRSVWARVTL